MKNETPKTTIKPTVGRVVWYYPHGESQPLAAIVAAVHSDSVVNLGVFDANGTPGGVHNVPLLQDGDISPAGPYCRWMPYQLGQAKKTKQAEADAAAKVAKPSGE